MCEYQVGQKHSRRFEYTVCFRCLRKQTEKIVNMVVCDPAQGNQVGGKLSKVEETIKPPKKKKKPNVKYTDRKPSSKPSTATVSLHEGSEVLEAETLLSGEEQFSTLTSYDGQKQYRPPDPTKTDAKFRAKKRNPLKSLQEEFSKVSKKMTDYQSEINQLNKSLAAQKRKLAEAVSKDGAATTKKDEKKDGGVGKKRLQTYGEWELSAKKGFHPSLKSFVSSQLREDLESNDDIQVIDNPDSTTSGHQVWGRRNVRNGIGTVMSQMTHCWFLVGHKCHQSAVAELAVTRVL